MPEVLNAGTQLLVTPLWIGKLGLSDYGLFQIALAWIALLSMVMAGGLTILAETKSARFGGEERSAISAEWFARVAMFAPVVMTAWILLAVTLQASLTSEAVVLVAANAALVALTPFWRLFLEERYGLLAVVLVFPRLAQTALLLARQEASLEHLLWVSAGAQVIAVSVFAEPVHAATAWRRTGVKYLPLRESVTLLLSQAAGLSFRSGYVFLVNWRFGPAAVAIVSVAEKSVRAIQTVLNRLLLSKINGMLRAAGEQGVPVTARHVTAVTGGFLVYLVAAVPLGLFFMRADPEQAGAVATLIAILGAGATIGSGAFGMARLFLVGRGGERAFMRATLVSASLGLGTFLLMPSDASLYWCVLPVLVMELVLLGLILKSRRTEPAR